MKKLLLLIGLCLMLFSCEEKLKFNYEIIKTDDRNPIVNVDVFVKDTLNIKKINDVIISDIDSNGDKFVLIRYFDDKEIAKTYNDKIIEVSDKEADILLKHVIGSYNSNPSTNYKKLTIN